MIALRPHLSSVTKWISSCASKSGKPQGVVIVVKLSGAKKWSWAPSKTHFDGSIEAPANYYFAGMRKMGRSRGLEPPTPGTTNQCSNQLSYDRHGFPKERCPW